MKAKHLMGGGIVDYKGKLSSLEQDTIDMDYVVGQIMMESFTSKLPGNNWYMSNIKQFSVVGDSLKREIALSHLLMRPCSAHYVLDISNYLPYLKYKSRRAVVVGKFLEPDLFWKGFLNHLNKKNESNKEREELIDACLRA